MQNETSESKLPERPAPESTSRPVCPWCGEEAKQFRAWPWMQGKWFQDIKCILVRCDNAHYWEAEVNQ